MWGDGSPTVSDTERQREQPLTDKIGRWKSHLSGPCYTGSVHKAGSPRRVSKRGSFVSGGCGVGGASGRGLPPGRIRVWTAPRPERDCSPRLQVWRPRVPFRPGPSGAYATCHLPSATGGPGRPLPGRAGGATKYDTAPTRCGAWFWCVRWKGSLRLTFRAARPAMPPHPLPGSLPPIPSGFPRRRRRA